MIPVFGRDNKSYICGEVRLGTKCKCECGQVASILATFRVLPGRGGFGETRQRKELGALLLCVQCAIEMWEMDRLAWQSNRQVNLTHFMGVRDAITIASEMDNCVRVVRGFRGKWKKIYAWMVQQESFTTSDVVRTFNCSSAQVSAALYKMKAEGLMVAEVVTDRQGNHYVWRANKQASGG